MLISKTILIASLLLVSGLAGCAPNSGTPSMTALDACKRADVKDKILDEIASSFATQSGGLLAIFGGPEAFNAVREDFKSRATIENPRVGDSPLADQKVYEVHCTVDLATVNSAKDNTPVGFRNVEFTIHYNNGTTDLGTEDYSLIPSKATFFRTVFVNGMPASEYTAQQQTQAPATEAPSNSTTATENDASLRPEQTAPAPDPDVDAAASEAERAADEAEKAARERM